MARRQRRLGHRRVGSARAALLPESLLHRATLGRLQNLRVRGALAVDEIDIFPEEYFDTTAAVPPLSENPAFFVEIFSKFQNKSGKHPGKFPDISGEFPGHFRVISRIFPGPFQAFSLKFPDFFREHFSAPPHPMCF